MRGWFLAAAIAAVAIMCGSAAAMPTIELRALRGLHVPEEFGDELRIYLTGTARIVPGPELTATSLAGRVREVSGSHAELVAWLEQAPDQNGGGFIVVVVGKRDGRAVVDIGEVPPSESSGRLLALQIGAFLDETLTSGVGEHALGAGPAPPPPRWIGIAVVAGRSELPDAMLAAAVGARHQAWLGELGAEVSGSLSSTTGTSPSVELDEQRAGVTVRAARDLAPFELGIEGAIDGERLHVVGVSSSGRAELTQDHLVARVLADASWWVTRQVAAHVALGVEHASEVDHFLIDHENLVTVGGPALVMWAGIIVRP